jgi:tyrosine kinase receptor 1
MTLALRPPAWVTRVALFLLLRGRGIQGCGVGKWGPDCTNDCPRHCANDPSHYSTPSCYSTTGYCNLGCDVGMWGNTTCENTCPPNCANHPSHFSTPWCHQDTGFCVLGCRVGYWGPGTCDKTCSPGCDHSPSHTFTPVCYQDSGLCCPGGICTPAPTPR